MDIFEFSLPGLLVCYLLSVRHREIAESIKFGLILILDQELASGIQLEEQEATLSNYRSVIKSKMESTSTEISNRIGNKITVRKGVDECIDAAQVNELLVSGRCRVSFLRSVAASLEDTFFNLTQESEN